LYGEQRITVLPQALSDRNGTAEFHVSSGRPQTAGDEDWNYGNKSSSLLPPGPAQSDVHGWLRFEERIVVETTTLATVMDRHAIERIDFLHMDVQGAELLVLRGAGGRIADIAAVWLEVEAVELYLDQPLRPEVEAFMKTAGFRLLLDTVGDVSGDQLYINNRLLAPSA
jgi:FkbM family methyltransferase